MLKLLSAVFTLVIVFFGGGQGVDTVEKPMQKPPRAEISVEDQNERDGIMILPELYGDEPEAVPYGE